jgi:hypothetical protein
VVREGNHSWYLITQKVHLQSGTGILLVLTSSPGICYLHRRILVQRAVHGDAGNILVAGPRAWIITQYLAFC